jgi:phenylalanyl-tRNA synthetase alpha subunit
MYDCYLGDISDEVAAKFMKNTEEVADEFAGKKIRQLQKLNLINKNFTAPQMYKSVPLNQIIQMIRQYRNQMEMQNIDSPEKISEFFYNMVKSNL